MNQPPLNLSQLEQRVLDAATQFRVAPSRIRRMMSTIIVSQMLPENLVVKGGMGVKVRMGETGTRATSDLDVSSVNRGEAIAKDFADRLRKGWGLVPASRGALKKDPMAEPRLAFTGDLKIMPIHDPGLAQPQYLIQPYKVTLLFLGKKWSSVDVEVADPEVGEHAHNPHVVADELVALSTYFGFGNLEPVELVELEFQIAQKIHAVTSITENRPNDLVDLQLLFSARPDIAAVRRYCESTFAFRNEHSWPPLPLRSMDEWSAAYELAREETIVGESTPVLPDLMAAREWLRARIVEIDR